MSLFEPLELYPEDPILSIPLKFKKDPREKKINLGVGAYRDKDGKPQVFRAVRQAEKVLLEKKGGKEYLPIDGDVEFRTLLLQLIYGNDSPALKEKRISSAQTIGGSGALRVAGEFLHSIGNETIYLSSPTWGNHHTIFSRIGYVIHEYSYYDPEKKALDLVGMKKALSSAEPHSIVLLQSSCHNPAGFDPTEEGWKEVEEVVRQNNLIPLFDIAYQGFGEGLDKDPFPIRYFVEKGNEVIVCSSCSKNFGLYGERVGMLSVVAKKEDEVKKISSHIKAIIRGIYSSPPIHGAAIVRTILSDEGLREEWKNELGEMRERIHSVRNQLAEKLQRKCSDHNFSFMDRQQGMFSFTGLTPEQAEALIQDYGIYLVKSGRINVAGINDANIDYLVDSIAKVIE